MKRSEEKIKKTVWGLTGGIACGKSTVAGIFSELGWEVIDADQIARDARKPGGVAAKEIQERFGTLDPMELRKIIFNDAQAKLDIEKILHPKIIEESTRLMNRLIDQGKDGIIYEASLLIETARYKSFRGLVLITAPDEARTQRLMGRDGISEAEAQTMIASQIPNKEREKFASHIIINDGTLEVLRSKVEELSHTLSS